MRKVSAPGVTNFDIGRQVWFRCLACVTPKQAENIRNNLLQSRDDMFHFRLYFIYFLNEMKSSLSRFQSLFIDYKSEFV